MLSTRFIAGVLLLQAIFLQPVSAQQNNFNEDYSVYLPEIRQLNNQLRWEFPPMPDSNAKTLLKPLARYIVGPHGNISLRIFRPAVSRAVVLDIHGGGWSEGMAAFNDVFNDELARRCSVAVVSVDYRLAPANPFPVGLDDCKAAAKWLVNNAVKEFHTEKIFISSGSAGSHLAALTTLYIRDSLNAISKIKGVNLEYGAYDLGGTPSFRQANDSTPFMNRQVLDYVFNLVFPGWTMAQKQDPRYSPLYADLHNLPPVIFTVGTADPLVDDTYFMEARWRLAGNKTYLAVYPEAPHAFDGFPVKMGKIAHEKIFQWIKERCE